jgi:hypothetical protein
MVRAHTERDTMPADPIKIDGLRFKVAPSGNVELTHDGEDVGFLYEEDARKVIFFLLDAFPRINRDLQ